MSIEERYDIKNLYWQKSKYLVTQMKTLSNSLKGNPSSSESHRSELSQSITNFQCPSKGHDPSHRRLIVPGGRIELLMLYLNAEKT